MDFTYEELREEEKRNIEIIESNTKTLEELDENINNINSIIEMIKKQGELDRQIESLKEQIAAFDKINPLFKNNNDKEKEALSEKKERLSELKTLLILNQNGNESDIQMLQRKKEEFEQKKELIEKENNDALDVMKNLVEICNEYIKELDNEISGKRTKQNEKSTKFGEIIEQYAKLEEELESYKKFNGFLTKKQQERISNIESEKVILEEKLTKVMPNLKKEIVNKAKASQVDAKFEAMEQREGKAIDRKTTIINSYKKVADEISKYLEENQKENNVEQDKNNVTEEKIIETNVEGKENKDQQPEQREIIVTKDLASQSKTLNNNASILNDTFMIKEDKQKKENKPLEKDFVVTKNIITNSNDLEEKKEESTPLTNDNWNKNEQNEFELFFGKPIETERNEELNQPIPQDEIENLIYDEKNPKEIKLDEPLTTEELEKLSNVKINNNDEKIENSKETEQNNQSREQIESKSVSEKEQEVITEPEEVGKEEPMFISPDSEINEFLRVLKDKEPEEIEKQPEIEKTQEIEDDEIYEYLRALKENAKELEIDKKIKRKVEKDKKHGRIKRFFMNIKNHFNEKKVSELRDELKQQEEKGGRTK